MLQLLFLTIILYIIIQHLMDETDEEQHKINDEKIVKINDKKIVKPKEESIKISIDPKPANSEIPDKLDNINNRSGMVSIVQVPKIISEGKMKNKENFAGSKQPDPESQVKEVLFDKPNPWSKIIIDQTQEYPYLFCIRVKIPSLNDFENWKLVVPNLNFDPMTGELIIPSKDESSAIALANLIVINFSGQISLKDILDKNLIDISVTKSKSFEVVQNKLREQIMENLYGKQFNVSQTSFEKDLAKKREPFINTNNESNNESNKKVDFKSENFTDTFEYFSDNNIEEGIEAWDGNDFSYL
jgi:hypothetical protein